MLLRPWWQVSGIAGIVLSICPKFALLQASHSLGKPLKLSHTGPEKSQDCVRFSPCPPDTASRGTYRDFLSHANLAEVGFHACAHLPNDCLCWLSLEWPLPGVELIPDGAVRQWTQLMRHCCGVSLATQEPPLHPLYKQWSPPG